jgi:hypothetical protein
MLHVWNLGLELGGAVDVPASRHRARPSERDEIGRLAPVPGLVGGVTDPVPKHIGRHVPTQITDAAARRSSTRFAERDRRSVTAEHQDAPHTQPSSGSRCEPAVVALRRAARDQHRGTLGQRLCTAVLQFAHLVAASAEAAQIVTLDPQVVLRETNARRQARGTLQRGRPSAQHDGFDLQR